MYRRPSTNPTLGIAHTAIHTITTHTINRNIPKTLDAKEKKGGLERYRGKMRKSTVKKYFISNMECAIFAWYFLLLPSSVNGTRRHSNCSNIVH